MSTLGVFYTWDCKLVAILLDPFSPTENDKLEMWLDLAS
jgi:hypothetical protein